MKIDFVITFEKEIVKARHPKLGRCTAYFNNVKSRLKEELGYECKSHGGGYGHILEGIKFDKPSRSEVKTIDDRFIVRDTHADFKEIWSECKVYFRKTIIQTRVVNVDDYSKEYFVTSKKDISNNFKN